MLAKDLIEWRKLVLERDNYTCQKCRAKDIRLEVHHVKPKDQYPHLALQISNGITLCVKCHRKEPSQAKLFQYVGLRCSKDGWGYPNRVTKLATIPSKDLPYAANSAISTQLLIQ
jgi:5-methylcytosine-specific restriction endonuclease McrA